MSDPLALLELGGGSHAAAAAAADPLAAAVVSDPLEGLEVEALGVAEDPLEALGVAGCVVPQRGRGRPPGWRSARLAKQPHQQEKKEQEEAHHTWIDDIVHQCIASSAASSSAAAKIPATAAAVAVSSNWSYSEVDAQIEILCSMLPGRIGSSTAATIFQHVAGHLRAVVPSIPEFAAELITKRFITVAKLNVASVILDYERIHLKHLLDVRSSTGSGHRIGKCILLRKVMTKPSLSEVG